MTVRIDAERCTGHGRCYTLAPELFDSNDEGAGVVRVDGKLSDELMVAAKRAMANCPEDAISLSD